jgi:hypothetical protein
MAAINSRTPRAETKTGNAKGERHVEDSTRHGAAQGADSSTHKGATGESAQRGAQGETRGATTPTPDTCTPVSQPHCLRLALNPRSESWRVDTCTRSAAHGSCFRAASGRFRRVAARSGMKCQKVARGTHRLGGGKGERGREE